MGLSYGEQQAATTTNFLFPSSSSGHLYAGEQQQHKPTGSSSSPSISNMPSATTTTSTTPATTKAPNLQELVGPLLPALPAAAVSPKPAETILPLLSPILRQRVQLLSSDDSGSWLDLLCYDKANLARLQEAAQGDRLELHPVSGEVEVDWDYDAETRYRRVDEETLQALVVLREMGLAFQLIYCTGDPVAGDGWRVGEVRALEKPSPFSSFGGVATISEAEAQFSEKTQKPAAVQAPTTTTNGHASHHHHLTVADEDEDDDDYWAQYDATPSRTPAMKRSPAPHASSTFGMTAPAAVEEDYYAQYDTVQPAMDGYDPDEDANMEDEPAPPPPLGLAHPTFGINEPPTNGKASANGNGNGKAISSGETENGGGDASEAPTQGTWTLAEPVPQSPSRSGGDPDLVHPHPRPASSASSRASVERLEAQAEKRDQAEFSVKQHVSRTIKSLYSLSRASGIDRQEFERLVRTELDMLELLED